jgi:uncharacterized protein (TIGR01777 family)
MHQFEFTTRLPHPREQVFAWFARPGALTRLSPPFAGSVRREPSRGIAVGSTAKIGIGAPGMLGLGLGAAMGSIAPLLHLPGWARPEVRWDARHVQLDPGRSFTDIMDSGPLASWQHRHVFEDDGGGTLMRDIVTYALPLTGARPGDARWAGPSNWTRARFEAELTRFFAYRERQLRGDLAFHERHGGLGNGAGASGGQAPQTIAVAGASGLIGTQLCALLTGGGHHVIRLVRRPARGPDEITWDPEVGELHAASMSACDAVVQLAGHPIGGRFTAANKRRILASRTAGTSLLARTLAELSADGRQRALVSASGIGYYGATAADRRGREEALTEDCGPGEDFLAQVCVAWEAACAPAAAASVRVVNVRTGIVQSPAGGMLQRLLPLYVAGLGGPLGSNAVQSWIGIDDIAGIHAHAVLDSSVTGPVNAVAPHPVTATEYARTLGKVLRRPARIRVPAVGPRLLLGEQGAHEVAFADQRVSAQRIEALGYQFRNRDLESALRHVLGRTA